MSVPEPKRSQVNPTWPIEPSPSLPYARRMNLSQLTSSQLNQLAKLAQAKETVLAKVAKIDQQMAALAGAQPAQKPAGRPQAKKRAKRGQVKATIVNLLKQAGKKGITVKEIAGKLGVSVQRIHIWFYGARKSMKQIKKMGPGKYRWA